MNILITGITGYIGSNLAIFLLKQKHNVIGVVRKNSDLYYLKKTNIENKLKLYIDKNNGDNLKSIFEQSKPELVFHLAAFQDINKNASVEDLINTNILFATKLLEAMVLTNCSMLINTSSYFQYYDNNYQPNSLYAATKKAFEDICIYYKNINHINIINLVLYDNYGQYDRRPKLLNLFLDTLKNNKSLNLTLGYQELSLTYIDDVVNAYVQAMYLLCSNTMDILDNSYDVRCKPVTIRKLVTTIEKIVKTKININWGAFDYRQNTMMKIVSNRHIIPNWKPKISLEQGIKKILEEKNEIT